MVQGKKQLNSKPKFAEVAIDDKDWAAHDLQVETTLVKT